MFLKGMKVDKVSNNVLGAKVNTFIIKLQPHCL